MKLFAGVLVLLLAATIDFVELSVVAHVAVVLMLFSG